MKKYIVLIVFLLITAIASGQIKLARQAEKVSEEVAFDYSNNWQGENYMSYIGQSLYVKPLSESSQKYGYREFYDMPDGNTYNPVTFYSSFTKYEALANKTVKVLDVITKGKDSFGNPNVYVK